ncbi:MAG: T9SS type A sorting domain-containing protein, partial [Bacteroidetes bacterium]|nr:T9SS type A sorting domain-containing protein [Bacteroidota bacterium]
MSAQHCLWRDTLVIDVVEPDEPPMEGLLAHVEGKASGSLGYVVSDHSALTGHAYRVTVEGEDHATKTLRVEDVTLGTTLYSGLPVPDRWAHDMPDIDGWRIRLGTAIDSIGYNAQGERVLGFEGRAVGTFSEPARAWMNFYNGYLLSGEDFLGSAIKMYDLVPVRLVFDRSNGQKGLAWLRGTSPNYAYQGYFDIPLRAYDISDPGQPRQLMVGFVEQLGSGADDNTWMPTYRPGDREYLLIFNDDYSETPAEKFKEPIMQIAEELDGLYGIWPLLHDTNPLFEDGDTFTIEPRIPISNRDVYITPPDILMDVHAAPVRPDAVTLHAPYPNPARERSVVTFDTRAAGPVSLTVHDMLGRRVATLVDRHLDAGTHRTNFDITRLRSGTYRLLLVSSAQRHTRTLTVLR